MEIIVMPATCEMHEQDKDDMLALTFPLHQDIRQTKRGVSVMFERASDSRRETAVLCGLSPSGNVECQTLRNDVTVNETITDKLTLLIRPSTDRCSGTYYCQLSYRQDLQDDHPLATCSVFFVGRAAKSSTKPPVTRENSTLSTTMKETEDGPEKSEADITAVAPESQECSEAVYRGLFFAMIVFMPASWVLVLVLYRHRTACKRLSTKNSAGMSDDTTVPSPDNEAGHKMLYNGNPCLDKNSNKPITCA